MQSEPKRQNAGREDDGQEAELSGLFRAAALLLAMGNQNAGRILQHLSDEELQKILRSASKLGKIAPETIELLVEDFESSMLQTSDLVGSEESALALLEGNLPEDKAKRLQSELRGEPTDDVWPKLPELPASDIAEHISMQHPQLAAYVISQLEGDLAAQILSLLEDSVRFEVLERMLSAKTTRERPAMLVNSGMSSILDDTANPGELTGTYARVAQVINQLDRDEADAAMAQLAETRPTDAEEIMKLLFRFEDVVTLPEDALTKVFSGVPAEHVINALTGMTPEFCEAVLNSVSPRSRRMIEAELKTAGKKPEDQIKASRNFISDVVLTLMQSNEIEREETTQE
ncbi:MAG: FliG C-terminal domain-containing protein [Hyphomicrobiaceae bacterium]